MTNEERIANRLMKMEQYIELFNVLAAYSDKVWSPKELLDAGLKNSLVNYSHEWLFALGMVKYVSKERKSVKFFVSSYGKKIFDIMGLPIKYETTPTIAPTDEKIKGSHDMLVDTIRNNPAAIQCSQNKNDNLYENIRKYFWIDLLMLRNNYFCIVEIKVSPLPSVINQTPGQILNYCHDFSKILKIDKDKIKAILVAPFYLADSRTMYTLANLSIDLEAYDLLKFIPQSNELNLKKIDLINNWVMKRKK